MPTLSGNTIAAQRFCRISNSIVFSGGITNAAELRARIANPRRQEPAQSLNP
jgi:hypothetical protein